MQRGASVKAFAAKPLGRAVLILLATLTVVGSFVYLGPYIAIPTLLLFGLLIPIYVGWKRPRQLAVAGLVALLIAAPIASVLETQLLRSPSPPVNSSTKAAYGHGGAVLEGAQVSPFTANGGSNFTFRTEIHASYVPPGDSPIQWLTLYISTCPGATTNHTPGCQAGYLFVTQNVSFPNASSVPTSYSFTVRLGGQNIWWWTMGAFVTNTTTGAPVWIFLDPMNTYGAVQGPVTGDFLSTYVFVVPAIYLALFLYAGSVFFFALLVYALFKSREARKRAQAEAQAGFKVRPPPGSPSPGGSPASPPSASPTAGSVVERACPNCKAVVYPNETTCWKCGTTLGKPPEAAPLPSSGGGST